MCSKHLLNLQHCLDRTRVIDFLAPLAMRAYLAPVFWMAGTEKLMHIESTAAWFGNPDWGLGLPFPLLMAYAAALTETIGAIALAIGLGVRWIAFPLITVMVVAALTVHIDNGWLAIADASHQGMQNLSRFMSWLEVEYPGRHEFITEHGTPVILNNGIEFAATYFVMLLALFFNGAGKYVSIDYWLHKKFHSQAAL